MQLLKSNTQYNNLTTLERIEDYELPSGVFVEQWLCRCSCGRELPVLAADIISEAVVKCPFSHAGGVKDISGNRYGKLVVLRRVENYISPTKTYQTPQWLCQCDCGTKKIILGKNLKSGRSQSCGCYARDYIRPHILPPGEASLNALYAQYERRAKERELIWQLNKKEFKKLTKQNCFYCGKSPQSVIHPGKNNGEYVYNGIDRVNNNEGYVPDNVVSCCGVCNWMKRDLSLEVFIRHIHTICAFHSYD